MTTPNEVLLQIQSQLKNSATLSYVKDENIHLGIRGNYSEFPVICIEPMNISDSYGATKGIQYIKMRVALLACINLDTGDQDEGIADASLNSILKLENDIKIVLDTDRTLNQKVYDLNYGTSTYDVTNYPMRGVQIEIEVLFKQNSITRT